MSLLLPRCLGGPYADAMPFLWTLCGAGLMRTRALQRGDTSDTGWSQLGAAACWRDRPASRVAAARVRRPAPSSAADAADPAAECSGPATAALRDTGQRAPGRAGFADRYRHAGGVTTVERQAHRGDRRHRAGAHHRRSHCRGGSLTQRDLGADRSARRSRLRPRRRPEPSIRPRRRSARSATRPGSAAGTRSASSTGSAARSTLAADRGISGRNSALIP